ncbi:sterol desaturase family protein [Jiulongibacter sp. NS-SX5]|uniref:sterol desaturase family protein n=1 Tax=Jiulongibacter sp. NS-SX5 TaxID=3463854 RepID=UPI004059A003
MEYINSFLRFIPVKFIQYFLLAGIPFLIFYVWKSSAFIKSKIQSKNALNKDFKREILHSLVTMMIIILMQVIFLVSPIKEYTLLYLEIDKYGPWFIPVSLLIALVIHDTYFYWMHRLVHHPRLFKIVHLVHHKSTNPSPWTSYSFQFFESISEAMILPILVFILPMHPISLMLFSFSSFAINVYGHLGYEILPKWFRKSWLFEIVNSSVYHNLHHSRFKGNYGLYFRVWDRLMKTEHPSYVAEYDKIQERRFGKSIAAIVLFTSLFFAPNLEGFAQQNDIKGIWQDEETNGLVNISVKDGKYFGKLLSFGNDEDDSILKKETVYILKEFEKESATQYCCGRVYLPKSKIHLDGEITVLNPNRLKIELIIGYVYKKEVFLKRAKGS